MTSFLTITPEAQWNADILEFSHNENSQLSNVPSNLPSLQIMSTIASKTKKRKFPWVISVHLNWNFTTTTTTTTTAAASSSVEILLFPRSRTHLRPYSRYTSLSPDIPLEIQCWFANFQLDIFRRHNCVLSFKLIQYSTFNGIYGCRIHIIVNW